MVGTLLCSRALGIVQVPSPIASPSSNHWGLPITFQFSLSSCANGFKGKGIDSLYSGAPHQFWAVLRWEHFERMKRVRRPPLLKWWNILLVFMELPVSFLVGLIYWDWDSWRSGNYTTQKRGLIVCQVCVPIFVFFLCDVAWQQHPDKYLGNHILTLWEFEGTSPIRSIGKQMSCKPACSGDNSKYWTFFGTVWCNIISLLESPGLPRMVIRGHWDNRSFCVSVIVHCRCWVH